MQRRGQAADIEYAGRGGNQEYGNHDYEREFHVRGRADNPVYVVSQVQSCNMSPLGLLGFGLTTALLQGATTAITEGSVVGIVYAMAFAYGGLAQLLAGMWEARRGKIFGAVVFSSYGAFWLSYAFYGVFSTSGIYASLGTAAPTDGLQMFLSLWGILTFLFFIISLALNGVLQALLLMLTITFFLLAGGVTHVTSNRVGGWFGIVTAAIAIYLGFAEMANEIWRRNVFPLFTINWIRHVFPPTAAVDEPYDVGRTEPKTFPMARGAARDNVGQTELKPGNQTAGTTGTTGGTATMV